MTEHLVVRIRNRHAVLEREIDRELAAPLPDSIRVMKLKKEKLHLRDRLRHLLTPERHPHAMTA